MTLLPTIALTLALLTTQGLLMYVVWRLLRQADAHAAQTQTITDACMTRLQAGTLQDYTMHLEREKQLAAEAEPEPQPAQPAPPDPDALSQKEYDSALSEAANGYIAHMGMPI